MYIFLHFWIILECGGDRYSPEGTITFPNIRGGATTGQGMDCGYRIVTTSGKIMNITFSEFRLKGPSPYCPYDYVTVSIQATMLHSFKMKFHASNY